ncbi:MAG: tRNA (adenosine(37)-N6)-dimethylallyltransferase MiaA [Eubacteriales bacterium]|nr:tRNA (adenosine(37)-N6)-dimethylallyltransferase MiaA [Eubacteriales bacterium]
MTDCSKKKMIVIAGPTAVGKTGLSVRLAKKLGTEIVSADSMQVYRGMDIGTAKVTKEEMCGIPHHMIDVCEPGCDFNVYSYQEMANRCLGGIYGKGKIPILCGGTGFYIQALLYGINFREEGPNEELRSKLHKIAEEEGNEKLWNLLRDVDPEAAQALPAGDVKRVIRAIEFFQVHGEKISEHNRKEEKKLSEPCYDVRFFVLFREQKELYQRIDARVDRMMEDGLLDEVNRLVSRGIPMESTSMQAIGYRQLAGYLKGTCSLEEAVRRIRSDSRHYAKRQLTWFKRDKNTIWIDTGKGDPFDEICGHLW